MAWPRQGLRGVCGYLHDADVVCAVQLALLDHLLLESGQVPLQMLPLPGVLLLQVCVQPCDLHLTGPRRFSVRETRSPEGRAGRRGG